MKKLVLLLLAIVSLSISAQDTKSFTPKNWVTDNGNFYTPEQEVQLNKIISNYEKKTSIEIGVITVESLDGTYIEEYASTQFKRLGIGKKGADNGILIVFSMKDRKSRIETGNGMEPFFSDVDSYDALQTVKPSFRAGNYAEGTINCIQSITNKLGNQAFANKVLWLKQKQDKEDKASAAAWASFKSAVIKFLLISSFFGILVFIYFVDKKRREKLRKEAEAEVYRLKVETERVERVKSNILSTEKYLKNITVTKPCIENSKILNSSYYSWLLVREHFQMNNMQKFYYE